MTIDLVTPEVVEALAKRVERLEDHVLMLRPVLKSLRPAQQDALFADNEELKQGFRGFLDMQGIHLQPIGAQALQKLISFNPQEPNEFSRGIIEMREE